MSGLDAELPSLPLEITEELDPGAVDQEIQGAIDVPIRDLDGLGLLPPTQCRIIRRGPVQARPLQQAGHHAGCLPQLQF